MIFYDQIGTTIELSDFPKRIISLVPSQSELLWDLGLREELIGITKFCIHPADMFQSVNKVGGTKTLNLDKIREHSPDLIIGNKEENEYSQIKELQKEFNVWMSDIYNLKDALKTIHAIGVLTDTEAKAQVIADGISQSFLNLKTINKKVLYLIWRKPYMAAGQATFIGDMLGSMGLRNVLADESSRYPELTLEQIKNLEPDTVFLSSEPYPFKEQHILEIQEQLPDTKILLVDGELFSWYGSRLLKSASYFNALLETL